MQIVNQSVRIGQRVHELTILRVRTEGQELVGEVEIGEELIEVHSEDVNEVWAMNLLKV